MQILHITPGRSGSTFITQILKQLYGEDNVLATHNYIDAGERKVVLTVRDFRDVLVSWWRTHSNLLPEELENGRKMAPNEIVKFTKDISLTIGALNKAADVNPDALVLRYKEFYPNNFDYLFAQFDAFFGEISDEDKQAVRDKFSFDKNIERQKKYKYFVDHIDNEGIHGNHMYKGTIGGWKELVNPEDYQLVNDGLAAHLKRWGYTS